MSSISPAPSQRPRLETQTHRGKGNRAESGAFHKKIANYFTHHLQTLFSSLGRICRSPMTSFLTVAVIGIALALPAGLHVLLKNVQSLSAGWEGAAQISLFLKKDINSKGASKIVRQLESMEGLAAVKYIPPTQALEEFKRLSGFNVTAVLEENPLPGVIVVQPSKAYSHPQAVEGLVRQLSGINDIEIAQLDMQWIKRLYALMEIGQRSVWLVAVILSLAVLLIIGNTIRLAIFNRRDEIEVKKMLGATDAFIRRPFLYTGFWYGLMGGILACILVVVSLVLLKEPIARLSALYESAFNLSSLGMATTLTLLASSALLGWVGSWLSVGKHLREIEPS